MRVVTTEDSRGWLEFVAIAGSHRVRAMLSVPLMVEELPTKPQMFGSLNMHRESPSAFDPFDEGLIRHYTVMVVAALNHGRRRRSAQETIEQLKSALTTRADIDQAKGALRAIHGCSAEDAFKRLVIGSQQKTSSCTPLHAGCRTREESAGSPRCQRMLATST